MLEVSVSPKNIKIRHNKHLLLIKLDIIIINMEETNLVKYCQQLKKKYH